MVYTDVSEGAVIVFADTASEAKTKALGHDVLDDAEYIQLRVKRIPKIDGLENCKPQDNYWDNGKIRLIMVRDYGWACIEPDGKDCEKCAARQICPANVMAEAYEKKSGLTKAEAAIDMFKLFGGLAKFGGRMEEEQRKVMEGYKFEEDNE